MYTLPTVLVSFSRHNLNSGSNFNDFLIFWKFRKRPFNGTINAHTTEFANFGKILRIINSTCMMAQGRKMTNYGPNKMLDLNNYNISSERSLTKRSYDCWKMFNYMSVLEYTQYDCTHTHTHSLLPPHTHSHTHTGSRWRQWLSVWTLIERLVNVGAVWPEPSPPSHLSYSGSTASQMRWDTVHVCSLKVLCTNRQ